MIDTTLAKKVGSTDDRPDRPANTKELPPASSQIPNPSSRWKDDLVEAQKQRAELQADLSRVNSEFQRLQNQARVDSRRIGDLTLDNSTLSVKLRDRAEELRGKAKLLEVRAALIARENLIHGSILRICNTRQ